MKHILQFIIAFSLLTFITSGNELFSQSKVDMHEVIISGQVTSIQKGMPVPDHRVVISNSEITDKYSEYIHEVFTDDEGYYYDTIPTTSSNGAFVVSTTDQEGKAIDTIVHYRFIERTKSILIANFAIYYNGHTEIVQARFKVFQKQNDDNLTFKFVDLTKSDNIIARLWEFGDGTTSIEANPEHTYKEYGLFKVKLHVIVESAGTYLQGDISKQVYSTDMEYYHMGGHAFSVHFPIDKGYAYLYYVDQYEKYIAVDTFAFDTLGYYYFYQVPEGNYVVKIEPRKESEYYGVLLPTYYGNEFYWQEAQIINLGSTSWEYDIKLEVANGIINGNGMIGGNVKYINNQEIGRLDDNAVGVQVYLFDESDNMLTYRYSNDRGGFDFDQINLGGYYIYPEVTGIASDKEYVQLTFIEPVVNNIEINIDLNNTSAVFPVADNGISLIGIPYPNPASNSISVPVNENTDELIVEIFNLNGQRVMEVGNINSQQSVLMFDIENLENGTYILNAHNQNTSTNYRFVVAR